MKLARKLTIGLTLGIFFVMSINAYVRVRREVGLFESERLENERLFARVLRASVETVWESEGSERAIALVSQVNTAVSDVQFRWLWLDDPDARRSIVLSPEMTDDLARGDSMARATVGGHGYAYVPIRLAQERPAALEVSESLDFQTRYLRDSLFQVGAATVGAATVCGLIAMALGVFFVGRPVSRLYEQTRRIGRGDLSQRLNISQRDEIGELAGAINTMCDQLIDANTRAGRETETRIAALEQLRHVDRLRTVGQLASGVAHELGTPLNVVSGHARIISREPDAREAVVTGAHIIAEQADRMATIIRQLLDFARRRAPRLETSDLSAIARGTIAMLSPLADKHRVHLELNAGPDAVPAKVDRFQAQQVITNLVMNAIQAAPAGGHVSIEVAEDVVADIGADVPRFVRLSVRDDGPGIPSETTTHVFEPFFTTKEIGEGTGLGLSVAYGIMQEHGGRIDVESAVGVGTTFSVFFQATTAAAERERS